LVFLTLLTPCLEILRWSVLKGSRRGRRDDNIAGQTDLAFAEKEHGFLLARFRFASREQWAIVHIRRMGFTGEQGEARITVSHAVKMNAFCVHLVNGHFPCGFLPTARVGLFRDFLPVPPVCKNFFPVRSGYSLAQGCFDAFLGSQRPFSPGCEDTTSVVCIVFMRVLSLFLHPDAAMGNLRRSIACRMDRNNSLGTATSAIWKTIFPEWRTTFAPRPLLKSPVHRW
jgi:hypothetical protein